MSGHRRAWRAIAWVCVGALLLAAAPAEAAIKCVTPTGAGLANGSSWDNACAGIADAIADSLASDELWVKEGTYTLAANVTTKANQKWYGGFFGDESTAGSYTSRHGGTTTIDKGGVRKDIILAGGETIDGFTIINGTGSNATGGWGGALTLSGKATGVTIQNCTFSGHSVGAAFVILRSGSSVANVIKNCTFFSNTGSAIYIWGRGNGGLPGLTTIDRCTFDSNSNPNTGDAGRGGAIVAFNVRGTYLRVYNSVFRNNSTTTGGGGAIGYKPDDYQAATTPFIYQCTFSGNTAGTALGHAFNTTQATGGGGTRYGTPDFKNCIFRGSDTAQIYMDWALNSVTIDYCNIQNGVASIENFNGGTITYGANNITSNPSLDANLRLQAGSPCIDIGSSSLGAAASGVDRDGVARPQPVGGGYDMGAYEKVPASYVITLATVPSGLQVTAAGNTQTAPFAFTLNEGTRAISVADNQSGGTGIRYAFNNWSDGQSISHTINVTAIATYTATFDTQYYWQSICKLVDEAPGGGTVDVADGWYNTGSTFTATASADSGFQFVRWVTVPGGVELGTAPALNVTMSAPLSVAAVFQPQTGSRSITVQSDPPGRAMLVDGVPTTGDTFSWGEGEQHTLAVVDTIQDVGGGTRYVFADWSPAGAASHTITVGAANATHTASFTTQYQWSSTASPADRGSVTPASGTWYDAGTSVDVEAIAEAGNELKWWTGDLSGSDPSPTVIMNGAKTVTAAFGATAAANVIYVDGATQGSPQDGTSWAKAYPTVQAALQVATSGKEIWVAAGTYKPGTLPTHYYNLVSGVGLYGGFGGYESARTQRNWVNNVTTLSGDLSGNDTPNWGNRTDNAVNVLYANGVNSVVVDGFTVSGGYSTTGTGGGMYGNNSGVTVANCLFTDNRASYGGGLYLYGTQATIERSRFVDNAAVVGGGGLYAQDYNFAGAGVIRNCVFSNNRCEGASDGKSDGGGISLTACPYSIESCTIYGNVTGRRGGGIKLYGGTVQNCVIKNCILWNNSTQTSNPDEQNGGWQLAAQQSVVLDVINTDWTPGTSQFYNYISTCTFTAMKEEDPLFLNAGSGDLHLTVNSPCKDAGTSSGAPSIDLDGLVRPQGPGYDIGAYEWDYPEYAVTLETLPSVGLQVSADGDTQTAPHAFTLYDGSHTIAVTTPQSGGAGIEYRFSGWSDSQPQSHGITVSAPASYTASFTTHYYWQSLCKLVDDQLGGGSVDVVNAWKDEGATFTATATAASGFEFVRWVTVPGGVQLSTLPALDVTMSAPVSVAAVFQPQSGMHQITVQSSPAGRVLVVDGQPTTGNIFAWAEDSEHTLEVADTIQDVGGGTRYVYTGWSPAGNQSHLITVGAANATHTASFTTQYQWTWTVSPAGSGSVTPASGTWHDAGSSPSVQATAGAGNEFKWWTGNLSGTSENPSVTMNGAKTVVAYFGATAAANVIYVDGTSQASPMDGSSWAKAYATVQAALTAATSGKEIWVAAGTYKPGTLPAHCFTLVSGVGLYGGFAGYEGARSERNWTLNTTTLSGDLSGNDTPSWGNRDDNAVNVLYANNVNGVVVDGFTVSGGYSRTGTGGGMYGNNSAVTVANCLYTDNRANYGGGMYLTGTQATIERSRFIANAAIGGGGGLHAQSYATAPVGTIRNCVFSGNRCEGASDGKSDGGGISLTGCAYSIENCTIYNNVTGRRGGGIKLYSPGSYVIKNCILWNNSTLTSNPGEQNGGWQLAVQNAGSMALDMRNTDWTPGTSQIYTYLVTPTFTALTESDPLFVNDSAGDLHLSSSSPCKDIGTSSGAPATDLDGLARPQGPGVDLGAYEWDYPEHSVIVDTVPTGQGVIVDGVTQTAPYMFSLWEGTHTISVAAAIAITADSQYAFNNWSDGQARSHSVTIAGPGSYTASYDLQYRWTVVATPAAGGSVGPASGWYNSGAVVSATVTPNAGWTLVDWTSVDAGVLGSSSPLSVTMTGPQSVSANLVRLRAITVASSPPGLAMSVDGVDTTGLSANWIDGSSHTLAVPVAFQLTAPDTRYAWQSWSQGGAQSQSVTASADATYTANFNLQFLITATCVKTTGGQPGGGTVSAPSGWYDNGSSFSITATADVGYQFANWTYEGSEISTDPVLQVDALAGPAAVVANFADAPVPLPPQTVIRFQ